ncbi:MAG: hypothetical protein LBS97_05750 [Treponema sp.]|jgi:hypothetical protein|nr:hypothetical protein [Treponema sp.]
MKRTGMSALMILMCGVFTVFAQEANQAAQPSQTGFTNTYVYRNIVVYKIRDYKDAFVITYAKHDKGLGQMIIPKHWVKEKPARFTIRNMPKKTDPYMSIYYNSNGMEHINMTLPLSRQNRVWGIIKGDALGTHDNMDTLPQFEF